ncbi:MAG: hypothetical protein II610_00980, partial [Treponema sp.]|nr:hypothetical protein [Treponema sp.]
SLFGLTGNNSSKIISKYSWAWIYFVSYNFFEASIIMNVVVGVIVDAVNASREEINQEKDEEDSSDKEKITLETISAQIAELNVRLGK